MSIFLFSVSVFGLVLLRLLKVFLARVCPVSRFLLNIYLFVCTSSLCVLGPEKGQATDRGRGRSRSRGLGLLRRYLLSFQLTFGLTHASINVPQDLHIDRGLEREREREGNMVKGAGRVG